MADNDNNESPLIDPRTGRPYVREDLSGQAEAMEDLARATELTVKTLQDYNNVNKENIKTLKDNSIRIASEINLLKNKAELTEQETSLLIDLTAKLEDQNKELERAIENYIDADEAAKGLAKEIKNLFGVTSNYNKTLEAQAFAMFKADDGTRSFGEGFKKLGKEMAKGKPFHASILSLQQKVVESTLALTVAQDSALVSFNKATGALRTYQDTITSLERRLSGYGITTEDVADSTASLQANFSRFASTSSVTRTSLIETTSLLGKMGVNSETTAKNITTMTKVMGIGAAKSAENVRGLFRLAQAIDMAPEQLSASFAEASASMAKFGTRGVEVFEKLAINARAANMEISKVLQIAEQFDTFDSAAQSVGKLNAILGGSFLNSLEMVTQTDPTERMRMLSDALNRAGQSFDEMDHFQRIAIADAAGLSDVADLALVMSGNFDMLPGSVQKSSAEILKMKQEAAEFNSIAEQFQILARQMAVSLLPLAQSLGKVVNFIGELNDKLGGHLPTIVISVVAGFKTMSVAINLFGLEVKKAMAPGATGLVSMFLTLVAISDASPKVKLGIGLITAAIGLLSLAFKGATAVALGFSAATFGIPLIIGGIVTAVAAMIEMFGAWGKQTNVGFSPSTMENFQNIQDQALTTAKAIGALSDSVESELVNSYGKMGDMTPSVNAEFRQTATTAQVVRQEVIGATKAVDSANSQRKTAAVVGTRLAGASPAAPTGPSEMTIRLEMNTDKLVSIAENTTEAIINGKKVNANVIIASA